MSRNKIGGWHRIWIVISAFWVVLVVMESGWSFLIVVPPLVLYVLGWSVGWKRRGFQG